MPEVTIHTGKEKRDVEMIYRFLTEDSYFAKGISSLEYRQEQNAVEDSINQPFV